MPPDDIEKRLSLMENSMQQVTEALRDVAQNMRDLVRLETSHAETRAALGRAFDSIEKIAEQGQDKHDKMDARLRLIEEALPELKTTSKWVKWGILGIIASVWAAVAGIVFVHGESQQTPVYVQVQPARQIPQIPQVPQLPQQQAQP